MIQRARAGNISNGDFFLVVGFVSFLAWSSPSVYSLYSFILKSRTNFMDTSASLRQISCFEGFSCEHSQTSAFQRLCSKPNI